VQKGRVPNTSNRVLDISNISAEGTNGLIERSRLMVQIPKKGESQSFLKAVHQSPTEGRRRLVT
jgi:hypothetical protein